MKKRLLVLVLFVLSLNIGYAQTNVNEDWALRPFVKVDSINPILQPNTDTEFLCPVRGSKVK